MNRRNFIKALFAAPFVAKAAIEVMKSHEVIDGSVVLNDIRDAFDKIRAVSYGARPSNTIIMPSEVYQRFVSEFGTETFDNNGIEVIRYD